MVTRSDYPLLTAEDFLDIDFGERKAELDNGVIRMMAGGAARHARQRTGRNSWTEQGFDDPADVVLPKLDLTIPPDEIVGRD
jgi:hypothetical protein